MDMNFKWHTRAEKLLVVAYWWEAQKGKCCICGGQMEPYTRDKTSSRLAATIEHLIPRRDNGPNTAGNVRLAHATCNHALGALFSINQEREKRSLPPLNEQWALANKKGPIRPKALHRQPYGLSLPRGATLMPEYLDKIVAAGPDAKTRMNAKAASDQVKRARKMTPNETAQWLAGLGIRGA